MGVEGPSVREAWAPEQSAPWPVGGETDSHPPSYVVPQDLVSPLTSAFHASVSPSWSDKLHESSTHVSFYLGLPCS